MKLLKSILKSMVLLVLFILVVCKTSQTAVKAEEAKIDLDGDGKKEKIKSTFSGKMGDDYEDGYISYKFTISINGKAVLKLTEKDYSYVTGIWCETFDFNPSDNYIDLVIMTSSRDYIFYNEVYRYKNNKLSLLFDLGDAMTPSGDARIPDKQKKGNTIIIENLRDSSIGMFFVPEEYKIKSKKLIYVLPDDFEYKIDILNDYTHTQIHWYELSQGKSIIDNDESWTWLPEGTRFYVTTLRCNVVLNREGKRYPEITEAYVITQNGASGWMSIFPERYESCIVNNPTIYGM